MLLSYKRFGWHRFAALEIDCGIKKREDIFKDLDPRCQKCFPEGLLKTPTEHACLDIAPPPPDWAFWTFWKYYTFSLWNLVSTSEFAYFWLLVRWHIFQGFFFFPKVILFPLGGFLFFLPIFSFQNLVIFMIFSQLFPVKNLKLGLSSPPRILS